MPDTIFAQATPPGRSGVAIIRISGPGAIEAASAFSAAPCPPRHATLRKLYDPVTCELIDEAVVLVFPGKGSFTGEPVVELQCHGSPAVVKRLLAALGRLDGLRQAEAGEFTRRALENGRLSLSQVEGLADLLAAETDAQRKQALQTATGYLAQLADAWKAPLVEALALVEAVIDFGDEGVEEAALAGVPELLGRVSVGMERALEGASASERVRDGFTVAIIGPPNVGKSTLMNALAGRDVALTSAVAGTTRDVIEVHLDLNGLPVTLLDTAGIRETEDGLEKLGIDRALARAESADLRVVLVGADVSAAAPEKHLQTGDILLGAKADVCVPSRGIPVSGLTRQGLDELLAAVSERLEAKAATASGIATQRQKGQVAHGLERVRLATHLLEQRPCEVELVAEELRLGLGALDRLVGRIDVEMVLDVIFKSFCIGK